MYVFVLLFLRNEISFFKAQEGFHQLKKGASHGQAWKQGKVPDILPEALGLIEWSWQYTTRPVATGSSTSQLRQKAVWMWTVQPWQPWSLKRPPFLPHFSATTRRCFQVLKAGEELLAQLERSLESRPAMRFFGLQYVLGFAFWTSGCF